jgi:hypothetical protein
MIFGSLHWHVSHLFSFLLMRNLSWGGMFMDCSLVGGEIGEMAQRSEGRKDGC